MSNSAAALDDMRRRIAPGRDGDRINAVLAAGYNLSPLLRWLAALLRAIIAAFSDSGSIAQTI